MNKSKIYRFVLKIGIMLVPQQADLVTKKLSKSSYFENYLVENFEEIAIFF